MTGFIPFPDIGPDIFSIDIGSFTFALRWYAMAYITGLLIGWRIVLLAVRNENLWPDKTAPLLAEQVEDLLTWVILGVILGGRLGFVLFYQPAYYFQNPSEILMVWQGGMSFHGGLLGVTIAGLVFCWKNGLPIVGVADAMALAVAPGLFLGRIANFINNELWGRPTDLPWGVTFPGAAAQDCLDVVGICARHPSQIYEAALEGALLGTLLLFLAWRLKWLKTPGQITGVFIAGYGVSRFIVEFFRQADAQFVTLENPLGYIVRFGEMGITMGQLLSLPMILVGVFFVIWARRHMPIIPSGKAGQQTP